MREPETDVPGLVVEREFARFGVIGTCSVPVSCCILAGVREILEDPARGMYFIAEIDGAAVGQTMVTFEWSDWRNGLFWRIQSVYLDTSFRRCGVFRVLYDHIRTLAESHPDVCRLRLYVIKQNTRAIETYRNLGMEVTDYRLCEEAWPTASG